MAGAIWLAAAQDLGGIHKALTQVVDDAQLHEDGGDFEGGRGRNGRVAGLGGRGQLAQQQLTQQQHRPGRAVPPGLVRLEQLSDVRSTCIGNILNVRRQRMT